MSDRAQQPGCLAGLDSSSEGVLWICGQLFAWKGQRVLHAHHCSCRS